MSINIDKANLPKHVAIIMDGNGRWAKKQGAKRIFGHRNAIKAVREATEGCAELGIDFLTLYAFSTENWDRPKAEVLGLMQLLVSTIRSETKTLTKNNVKLKAIGDLSKLPSDCRKELQEAMQLTEGNTGLTLVLALSYSGRWDLTQATRRMSEDFKEGKIDSIEQDTIKQYLSTATMPDPELLIRTSGEQRISNFLLWEIAYTELFFTNILWPDFRRDVLHDAIMAFQNRERRYGKTSEQLTT
ncbi:isoprenyl transferase [Flammeovirga yaeyamensis]|uniref:Isoprenyl transferase n=1 Tax=Flammeovirga yaeyamensis TaxID=367791 RepID=A0AAX1N7U5_9BACT|nr:isoprenyl transferase [Flammeovirga yaeyamensis]MBB3698966.1 undecaprenyl diphosphate synthase [Flammeovirga yaeyamensis]NMF36400.1 isoprenyl transferase [Flammeovirga yaeyamensis]QWG03639.1 isoprenyl transferase [Flammeovirga yaeyamensis]